MSDEKNYGLIGSGMLAIGVFMPVLHIPVIGSMNYFRNGQGDGVIILVFAIFSFLFVLSKRYTPLLYTGILSILVMANSIWQFTSSMNELMEERKTSLANNPFKGLVDTFQQSVQLEWGWAVMLIGAGLLITSSVIARNSKKTSEAENQPLVKSTIKKRTTYRSYWTAGLLIVMALTITCNIYKDNIRGLFLSSFASISVDLDTQRKIANRLYHGEGVPVDQERAFEIWKAAAEAGDIKSQYNVAQSYRSGEGTKKNMKEAAHWYTRAADMGDSDSQTILGQLYSLGEGVTKNMKKAEALWLMAEKQGNPKASYFLAAHYYEGSFNGKDIFKAKKYGELAASKGNANAMMLLALISLNDDPVDIRDAYKWMALAAGNGAINQTHKAADLIESMTVQDVLTSKKSAQNFSIKNNIQPPKF